MIQQISAYIILFCLCLTCSSLSIAEARVDEPSLLMVGNSYIDYFNMESMVGSLLKESGQEDVLAKRFEHGSARFLDFADTPELRSLISERSWTWVLLQEQSEIPALLEETDDYEKSKTALITLDNWIRKTGATTVLLMTWGRLTFDHYNPSFFKDFLFMQNRLKDGYQQYANLISARARDRPVKIAPAGMAFMKIYEKVRFEGKDPTAADNDFSLLYNENDKDHLGYPSMAGSYLTACVIYCTLTGKDASAMKWAPAGLEKEYAERLRTYATETAKEYDFEPMPPTAAPYVPHDTTEDNSKPKDSSNRREGSSIFFNFVLLAMFGGFVVYVVLPRWKIYKANRSYYHNRIVGAHQSASDYEMPYVPVDLGDDPLL